jgi:hypothetical protein
MTEESKAEIFNTIQYSLLGVAPVVVLNKLVQRFIPEADPDKSSMEIAVEVLIQIIIMFVGVILIHRIITFLPTYSEFKYDNLSLTNVILTFLILVLSLQTKIGIKVNILADRAMELWNGTTENMETQKSSSVRRVSNHAPSQGDTLGSTQSDMFPPAPVVTTRQEQGPDVMIRGNPSNHVPIDMGPMAANGILGGSFGSSF